MKYILSFHTGITMAVAGGIKRLFHFTDRANLPSIQRYGGIYSYARLVEMGIEIPAPGGNEWSREADANKGMDRYVHLCLRRNHPMEYIARTDGRIKSSYFLEIHEKVLKIENVKFTDAVSNKTGTQTYSIKQAMEIIDFDMLYGGRKNWKDAEIQARLQRVERYEILVPDYVPFDLILNFPDG